MSTIVSSQSVEQKHVHANQRVIKEEDEEEEDCNFDSENDSSAFDIDRLTKTNRIQIELNNQLITLSANYRTIVTEPIHEKVVVKGRVSGLSLNNNSRFICL